MNLNISNIFNYNNFHLNNPNKRQNQSSFNKLNNLTADTFVKSTSFSPSFKGKMLEIENLEKDEVIKCVNPEFKKDYVEWCAFLDRFMRDVVTDKRDRKISPNTSIAQYNNIVFKDNPKALYAKSNIERILKNAGITNCREFFELSKMYDGIIKEFPELKRYALHFVNVFNKLNDKRDLARFPNSIATGENSIMYSDEADSDINELVEAIKELGFESERTMISKNIHLKDSFNDFKNPYEVLYLIDYLSENAAKCEDDINSFIETYPEYQDINPVTLYCRIPRIFDYFHDTNYDYSDEKRNELLQTAMAFDSLNATTKAKLSEFFDIKTTEGRIELFCALSEQNLSPQTLNNISKCNLIQGSNPIINSILNKNAAVQNIIEYKSLSKEDAEAFYMDFVETFSCVFDTNDETSQKRLQDTLKIIDEFDIKNDSQFISLFKAINNPQDPKTNAKKKQKKSNNSKNKIIKNDIKEFVDLLLFADKNTVAEYKRGNVAHIKQALLEKKQRFEKIKPELEEYLANTDSVYFAGQSAFEVFMENQDLLQKNKKGVIEAFNYAALLKPDDKDDYTKREEAFNKLLEYFPDRITAKDFIIENGIKLDSSKRSRAHRNCVGKILAALKDEDNPKSYTDSIKQLTKSGFIRNSKSNIGTLIKIAEREPGLRAVLRLAVDKKLESAKTLTTILQSYSDEKTGNFKEILGYLKNLPSDISFEEFIEQINQIQTSLNSAGIPIKITGDSICLLNPKDVMAYKKGQSSQLIKLAAQLSNKKDKNFISGLNSAFTNKTHNITPREIAREIAKPDKNDGPYTNIIRELKLSKKDLGINETNIDNQSEYMYALANALSEEFVSFINSDDWTNFTRDASIQPNLTLHAKLRAIERFALNEKGSIKHLYSEETKIKMQNLFKTIYNKMPEKIEKSKIDNKFIAYFSYGTGKIKTVFNNNGKMITIIKTD